MVFAQLVLYLVLGKTLVALTNKVFGLKRKFQLGGGYGFDRYPLLA